MGKFVEPVLAEWFTGPGRRLQAQQFTSSQPPLRRRVRRQALPVHTGDEPLPLFCADLPSVIIGSGLEELATVQPAQAHPDARAIPAHHLQARTAPIGKHVGRAFALRTAQRLLHVQ